jgi:hypothetical protein
VDGLKQAFQPPNHHQHLRDSWFKLKQTGSVAQYVHEFRALRLQLMTSDDEALDKFVRGLKFNTRREVMIRNPDTVEEAIRIADRFDMVITHDSVPLGGVPGPLTPVTSTGVQPMELDRITIGVPGKKLSTGEIERLKAARACFYCYKPGHMAKDCRLKKRQQPITSRVAVVTEQDGRDHESLQENSKSQ